MLLHFALVLHFAAILITFCVNITVCGDYYILRRNTRCPMRSFTHQTVLPTWQAFEREGKGSFRREKNARGARGEGGKSLPGDHCFPRFLPPAGEC